MQNDKKYPKKKKTGYRASITHSQHSSQLDVRFRTILI
jgi:hypothetical protein